MLPGGSFRSCFIWKCLYPILVNIEYVSILQISFFIVQVFLQYSEPISFEHVLNPICSDVIVDEHSHPQLKIDASYPVIATDEGNRNQKYWLMAIFYFRYV